MFLPTIAGLPALTYYRRYFLVKSYSKTTVSVKIFLTLFYFLQGVLFSYLMAGVLAKTVWNYTNKKVADGHTAELIECPVIEFQTGKYSYIYYLFQNKKVKLNTSCKTLAAYERENPGKYNLKFTVRKGVWNYYVVESWEIERSLL